MPAPPDFPGPDPTCPGTPKKVRGVTRKHDPNSRPQGVISVNPSICSTQIVPWSRSPHTTLAVNARRESRGPVRAIGAGPVGPRVASRTTVLRPRLAAVSGRFTHLCGSVILMAVSFRP